MFAPAIIEKPVQDRFTGGYLANARLAEVAAIPLHHAESLGDVGQLIESGVAEPAILDSIFLFDADFAADQLPSQTRLLLLAHSLPSMIPGQPIAERRASLHRERAFLSECRGAIAPSRFLAQALVRRGMPARTIRVVPLAPITDGRSKSVPKTAQRRDVLRRGETQPVQILSVGSVVPAKGYLDAARALREIRSVDWRWMIVGRADASDNCVAQIVSILGTATAENRVRIAGTIAPEQMPSVFADADVFLMPSMMESFGIALAEAMSFAVPTVAYGVAAVGETVGDRDQLVRVGDIRGLARAITRAAREGSVAPRHDDLLTWNETGKRFREAVLDLGRKRSAA